MQTIPTKQLVYLLRSEVIPRVFVGTRSNFFVARHKTNLLVLPDTVSITRRELVGPRVVVRNRRKFGNVRNFVAEWPKDNLQELAVPRLECVISGVADYLVGDYCARCEPGTFFLIPPMVPHQCNSPFLAGDRLENGSYTLFHAYAYKGGIFFWCSRSTNGHHVNEKPENFLIPSLTAEQTLLSLLSESMERKSHLGSVARGLMGAFFAIIACELEAGNYTHPGPQKNVLLPPRTQSFTDQVQEYVQANCYKRLRLADVAAYMYVSRSQFARRMKDEMGMTFVELLTRARIERACQMLCDTEFTCNAIATSLSFRSSTYFQSLFRSRVGCTPMEYRKKNASLKN